MGEPNKDTQAKDQSEDVSRSEAASKSSYVCDTYITTNVSESHEVDTRRMASVAESNTFTTTGVYLIPFLVLAAILCYVLYRQFPRRKRRGSVTELQEIVVEYPERHTRRDQIRY